MELEKTSLYLEKEQFDKLRLLSTATRIKMSDYIREGVNMVLKKHEKEVKKAKRRRK